VTWHVVLVTGSRRPPPGGQTWSTLRDRIAWHQSEAVKNERELVLVHGGADGIDTMAASLPVWDHVICCPALWKRYGRRAGPKRNVAMVRLGLSLRNSGSRVYCEAFPYGPSPGTRGCLSAARDNALITHVTELTPPKAGGGSC
jgi:hypothetical protein